MARLTATLVIAVFLLGAGFGLDAQAGHSYTRSTFTRGMTPLSTYQVVYPPAQTYSKTTFTRGLTVLTGDTVCHRASSGQVYNRSWLVNLGFSFQFYGQTFTQAYLSQNGFLTFNASGATSNANRTIPTTSAPNGFIAPFWDYLYMYYTPGTAMVSYKVTGSTPNRVFTAQWYKMNTPGYTASYRTAQVVLYEATKIVEIKYDTSQNWYTGSATIGIENNTGTAGMGGPNSLTSNNSCPSVNYRFSPVTSSYDDQVTLVNIGFALQYFANTYTQVNISTNGLIAFTASGATVAANDPIPNTNAPNDYIALFWDDLIVGTNGVIDQIRYGTTGTSPNRVFIIEYYGLTRKNNSGSELTGQIHLYETSYRIELHYDNTAANNIWTGVSATIGLEDSTGTSGSGGPNTTNTNSTLPPSNYRFDLVITYGLTVASPQGSPTPAVGVHYYPMGTQVTLNSNSPATGGPGTRHVCTGYTGTGDVPFTGTTSSVTFTINQTSSITWIWTVENYLTLIANPGVGGNPQPSPAGPWFQPGSLVTIFANPNTGYVFNNWTGAVSSINNPETFTMNSPMTVTANYFPPPSTLAVSGNPQPYGSPSPPYGTHTYTTGSPVTASVTSPVAGPTGERYVCTGWTGTGDVPASGAGTTVSFTFNGTSSLTWNWIVEYRLTTNVSPASSGSVAAAPAGPWYASGTNVTVTATPNTGFQFVDWTGNLTSTNNPDSFTVTAASAVTANFGLPQALVSVNSTHGNPSPSIGTHSFDQGSQVTCSVSSPIPAGAGARYKCTGWTGTGDVPSTGTGSSATFTLNSNSSITWNWVTEYELSMTASPAVGGIVSANPAGGWYTQGTVVTVQAAENTNYNFTGWGGDLTGSNNPETVTFGSAYITVIANFVADGPPLTVTSAYGFPTPPAGTQTYVSGTQVDCSVVSPAQGPTGVRYVCTGWTGTGSAPASGTVTNVSFNITETSTLTWHWQVEYEVTVISDPPGIGSVTRSPVMLWYPENSLLTLTASSSAGYRFFAWSGDLQSLDNPMSFLVNGAMNLIANYVGGVSLGLSAGPLNPVDSDEIASATGVPMLHLALSAGQSEGIDVSTVRVTVTGISDETITVTNASLYHDVNGDGFYRPSVDHVFATGVTIPSDDGEAVFTGSPVRIPASGVAFMLVTFDFNASPGDDFLASIADNNDITATGVNSSVGVPCTGAPLQGGLKTIKTVGSPGTLEVYVGANNPATASLGPGASNISMLQMVLRASSIEDVTVTDLILKGAGSGIEPAGVARVRLFCDVNEDGILDGGDTPIGVQTSYTADDGNVTFSGLSRSIPAGSPAFWLVVYDFTGASPDGCYQVGVMHGADIVATGDTSLASLNPVGPPITGRVLVIDSQATAGTGEFTYFVGACGGPATGGLPLLSLLPLAFVLYRLARRRRDA